MKSIIQSPKFKLFFVLSLWFLLWAGYNTNPGGKLDVSNAIIFFQHFRAYFPILAGLLAVFLFFLEKKHFSIKSFKTPLGFLFLYALVGFFSSVVFSKEPLIALYWNFSYLSPILILFAAEKTHLFSIIKLNWFIIFGIVLALIIGFFFLVPKPLRSSILPSVIPSLSHSLGISELDSSFLHFENRNNHHLKATNKQELKKPEKILGRPYEDLALAGKNFLGMPLTRPTGLGRYAGFLAILSLAWLLVQKRKLKFFLWLIVFLLSFSILAFSQARTAIISFLVAAFAMFFALKPKFFSILTGFIIIPSILFVLFFFILHPSVYHYFRAKAPFIFTLSGRTYSVWPYVWHFFLKSPLFGWGFYAGRIFLNKHPHNAILHSLVQTGIIGTIFFILSFIFSWFFLFKAVRRKDLFEKEKFFLIAITGILTFFTLRGITESSGAFFGADWLILAPFLAYLGKISSELEPNHSAEITNNR